MRENRCSRAPGGRFIVASLLVAGLALIAADSEDGQAVRKVIEDTFDRTVAILENPALKGEEKQDERREQLRTTLLSATDIRRVSQLALGRQRNKFSEAQIDEFSQVFSQLVFVTYIANLENYSGEKLEILAIDILPKGKACAATKVITADKEVPADFNFFKDENGAWKVYDVKVEGVSMVSNYRSQFSEMLLKDTPDELIAHLREKVKENEEAD